MELGIMHDIFNKNLPDEHILIAKYIFKGYTNSQIAQKINRSTSGASYKIYSLFEKYKAKNRIEFIVNIFAKIINIKKEEIQKQEELIMNYENKIECIKKIIVGLIKNKSNSDNFKYWCSEAKKHF